MYLLWIGFVCAISFMEAWLKFRAPGVTIPIGLSIGMVVFGTLNKVEWLFAIIIFNTLLIGKNSVKFSNTTTYGIAALILIIQTVWLLPALDKLVNAYIEGQTLPASPLHWYFVVAELIKIIALFLFGISLLI